MEQAKSGDRIKKISLLAVPILCILFIVFFDLKPGDREITYTAAIALLMAAWWITEAIPLAVTALIPLILFPAFGVMDGKAVSMQYVNHIIFIFIGGFMVALAMERWNLHKRLALRILILFGSNPRFILLGFMLATAFLSMWISNTATAMMMIPIAIAIVSKLDEISGKEKVRKFSIGIFLGIAYSASIGGVATLIGTPPNLSFVRIFNIFFPRAPEISFAQWFLFAFPVSVVFLFLTWFFLSLIFCPRKGLAVDRQIFTDQYKTLGHISFEEKVVLIDFLLLVILWMFRSDINIGNFKMPGWSNLLPQARFINDGTVAVTMAFLLFLIPAKNRKGGRVMDWKTAVRLPWGIVLLFGGGFALAGGFKESGLSAYLGEQLQGLGSLPPIVIIVCICLFITFLTELTSNTATAEILLPVLAALAVSLKVNPLLLMIPGTLSCSFAFMLPVATPPNAIVFGTERIRISDMVRTGVLLNLIGVILITIAVFLIGKGVFGIDLAAMPAWMQ
ncbi:MAG: SLC13/DASS family transporter [Candidatus Aminicenantes bacterium]|nr:SLC13/DASS family transporter [Candidatus Aminicenantes bacterium]